MQKICFIIIGGTFDGFYQPESETSKPSEESIIPHYIKDVIKPHFKATFKTVCMLDSGDITDPIRKKIAHAVARARERHVIITHGTNTMTKTADYLKRHLDESLGKIVVLTGAMVPLKEFAMSDGGFNLGFAIAALEHLKPGVYIAMNGRVFAAGKVKKNFKKARFEGS